MVDVDDHLESGGGGVFKHALKHLRDRDADDIQIELFELAVSYAELSAAKILDDFTDTKLNLVNPSNKFISSINQYYLARVL